MHGPTVQTTRFISSDISDDGDADRLETDLSGLDGVRDVSVDPHNHCVDVTYNQDVVDDNDIKQMLERSGYHVSVEDDVRGGRSV